MSIAGAGPHAPACWLVVVDSARLIEDAARIAYGGLIAWMLELGWDRWEAYLALTRIGDCSVGNMVDTHHSVVAKIGKAYATINSSSWLRTF